MTYLIFYKVETIEQSCGCNPDIHLAHVPAYAYATPCDMTLASYVEVSA